MRGVVLIPVLAPVFAVAGCTSFAPPVASRAGNGASVADVIAATDLIQAGQVAKLAAALSPPSDAMTSGSVALMLDEAGSGLIGDGATLVGGVSRPRAAAAHLEAALPGLRALQAGYLAAGSDQAGQAGKMAGYLGAFMAAARSYDADASAAGLPTARLTGE